MTKSSAKKINLTVKLADGKTARARINPSPIQKRVRLEDMNDDELRREIESLPRKIVAARELRDRLWSRLKERWSTAYANDDEFVTAYAQAEAAGAEVVYLLDRAARSGRVWYERTSGKLV